MTELYERPEDVGEILVKVQEDLQQLRDALLQKNLGAGNKALDISSLESAIEKTEDGIKAQSERILGVVNNRITTLPSVDATKSKSSDPHAIQESVWDIGGNDEYPSKRGNNLYTDRIIPRYTSLEPERDGGPYGPSAGQQSKFLYNMKALVDPTSTQNRRVLSDNYGVTLPALVDKKASKVPQVKAVTGSTVEHLAVLPRANRVDPQLNPPPIHEADARKGILSLIERGLIPPAAELTLDPNPVRHRAVELHDPTEKKDNKLGPGGFGDGTYNLAHVKVDVENLHQTSDSLAKQAAVSPIIAKVPSSALSGDDLSSNQSPARSRATSAKSSKSQLVPLKTIEPLPPPTTPAAEFKHLSHRFVIQNGRTRENGKDYLAFKQHFCLSWGSIVTTLKYLEKFMRSYAVPLAFINGDKLADLAIESELSKPPRRKDFLGVIINIDDVRTLIEKPGRRYKGHDGRDVAATKIQSTWRRYQDRLAYLDYRKQKWAAGVIALSWVMHVKMAKVKGQLKVARRIELDAFRERLKGFQQSWKRVKSSRRVLVHVPSLGYSQKIRSTINDFNIIQNQQMGRLCDLVDPNVDVIYVSPVTINDETLQYYNKLLGLRSAVESGTVESQKDMSSRFTIIIPESVNSFPTHSMCLATFLKYSPRALRRIKSLVAGKEAYIVPGVMHKDDLSVAQELNLPVLGSEPEVAQLYSTKSGSKRIFASAGVAVPPSDYDVYSLQQLHESIAQLVTENLDVKTYLFKLDDEFDGRGIAYCHITENLRCHAWAKKECLRYGEKWSNKWAQEPAFVKIHAEIPDVLAKFAHPVNKKVFATWDKFLESFLSQGGVIEACPPSDSITALTVNMLIEPDGHTSMVSCGDQIHAGTPYACWGLSVPQSSVDPSQLTRACYKIADSCKHRGVMGYFAVDFVTFIDPTTREQELWAVDLNLWYDDSMAMTQLMLYVTDGTLDVDSCLFNIRPPKKEKKKNLRRVRYEDLDPEEPPVTTRYAVMSTRLMHTNLAVVHYSVFFQMCRAHGIGYDIKEKQGTLFTLIDSFKREVMGMLTIGDQLPGTLSSFARNLSIIHQEISAPNMQGHTNFKSVIEDIEGILGTTIQNMDETDEDESGEAGAISQDA
ncbi:putative IQ domain-containing protein H isoform X2 [Apostichopus japonicus]|uniref:Putative IQ domain-containing protein H isoform X2 n=1 Tax=Stichopus japonicus TaxID=307972 RepID=A0A2G8LAS2_STIJA|nr:putative IQ domain-containing protein H isoform X2 [Apostichopus japonicus]